MPRSLLTWGLWVTVSSTSGAAGDRPPTCVGHDEVSVTGPQKLWIPRTSCESQVATICAHPHTPLAGKAVPPGAALAKVTGSFPQGTCWTLPMCLSRAELHLQLFPVINVMVTMTTALREVDEFV